MDTTLHLAALSARHPHMHGSPLWTRLSHSLAFAMVAVAVLLAFTAVFGTTS